MSNSTVWFRCYVEVRELRTLQILQTLPTLCGNYGHYRLCRSYGAEDVADVTDITDVAGVTDITDIMGGTVRHMAYTWPAKWATVASYCGPCPYVLILTPLLWDKNPSLKKIGERSTGGPVVTPLHVKHVFVFALGWDSLVNASYRTWLNEPRHGSMDLYVTDCRRHLVTEWISM